jgi:hypothetical protein
MGCADQNDHYVDLETGKHITVVKDSTNGIMINKETREPVAIYVDTDTKDTIYGKTGEVINNRVIKTEDGKYSYAAADNDPAKVKTEEDGDYKIKDDEYKKKVEKDGDVKIKEGDDKIKVDAENGETKVKTD